MKLKKLAAIFLSAVMAVSVTTSAFADTTGPQTGSITVTGVHSGDRHLVAYKLFDATTDGSDHYGYTLNTKYRAVLAEALGISGGPTEKSNAVIGQEMLEKLELMTSEDNAPKDSTDAKNFADFMQKALTTGDYKNLQPEVDSNDFSKTEETAQNDTTYTYSTNNVGLGYYIVIDKGAGTKEYAPTFAMLSPANTNAQAIAKDSNVTSGKSVETDGTFANTGNVNIGDEITYQITGDIPAYASTGNDQYKVILTDTLSEDLQYVEIKSVELNGGNVTVTPFDPDNVTFKDKSGSATTDMTKAVSFVFDKNVVDKTVDPKIDYLSDKAATITITYTAKVISAEKIVDSNTNTFKYEYGNPSSTLKSLEKEATVYTYGFKVFKFTQEGETQTPLAGAEFNLTKKDDTIPLKFTENLDGNYIYDANGSATLVSGEDGYVNIAGLDAGDYVLEETKAPNGYNLLADTIDVTINATRDTTTQELTGEATVSYKLTHGTGNPTNAADSVSVENTTGTTLPGTGGMGTTPFIVGGLLILCAAGAFLFFNRKRVFGK